MDGFPDDHTGAMTGSLLVLGMGFTSALWAMLIGNLIMLVYAGLLGLLGTKKGFNLGSPQNSEKIVRLGGRAYVSAPKAHQDADSCCRSFSLCN